MIMAKLPSLIFLEHHTDFKAEQYIKSLLPSFIKAGYQILAIEGNYNFDLALIEEAQKQTLAAIEEANFSIDRLKELGLDEVYFLLKEISDDPEQHIVNYARYLTEAPARLEKLGSYKLALAQGMEIRALESRDYTKITHKNLLKQETYDYRDAVMGQALIEHTSADQGGLIMMVGVSHGKGLQKYLSEHDVAHQSQYVFIYPYADHPTLQLSKKMAKTDQDIVNDGWLEFQASQAALGAQALQINNCNLDLPEVSAACTKFIEDAVANATAQYDNSETEMLGAIKQDEL
jgi:hypothetical protein